MDSLEKAIINHIEANNLDKSLLPVRGEAPKEYTNRIFNSKNNYLFINDIMEITLHWLDKVKCPFPTWKEDVHFYNRLEEAFNLPHKEGVDRQLQHNVIHHIQKNITHSINVNRTPQEVFRGWDDE